MTASLAQHDVPRLRGWVHFGAALAAPLGLVHLVLAADSAAGYVGAAIFGTGMILLFSTSAAYHLLPWGPRLREAARRLDHAMIFVAIASIYTPFCLLVLPLAWGIPLLSTVWGLAGAGILVRNAWPRAPRGVNVAGYLLLGWTALVASLELGSRLGATALALIVAAGLLYTVGAVVFALHRPNPFPRTFGHHEIFHVLVTVATLLLFGVVAAQV
jgi:hemolysin III